MTETGVAVLSGLIQGLTEFLPISSSGHLALFQQYMGMTEPPLAYD
ncbi:MAG TPA: undecaprenyl-diphosphate phosphatase, partial [Synergistaceae bacterium]|nr:undecaprenyl-diphosphate phosphatase [Synergistaceae bacterium]